jgi:hypothetical protein
MSSKLRQILLKRRQRALAPSRELATLISNSNKVVYVYVQRIDNILNVAFHDAKLRSNIRLLTYDLDDINHNWLRSPSTINILNGKYRGIVDIQIKYDYGILGWRRDGDHACHVYNDDVIHIWNAFIRSGYRPTELE